MTAPVPAGTVHMPCGCPYPPVGDHRPCEHGDCGHCPKGACVKMSVPPGAITRALAAMHLRHCGPGCDEPDEAEIDVGLVDAGLEAASPVLRDHWAAQLRAEVAAELLAALGRHRVTGFDPFGNCGNADYVPWDRVAEVFGAAVTFGGDQ